MLPLLIGVLLTALGASGFLTGRLPRAHPSERTGRWFQRHTAPRAFFWCCVLWAGGGVLLMVAGRAHWFGLH